MQNKSKSRTDVQWVISSISLAATVGLWGLFASTEKKIAGVTSEATIPSQPDPILASAVPTLLPGQRLLLAGAAPQAPTQPSPTVVTRNRRRGGGGGGGASTGSSKP
jgi:hypothetical protein